jgi:hypothetical protein
MALLASPVIGNAKREPTGIAAKAGYPPTFSWLEKMTAPHVSLKHSA